MKSRWLAVACLALLCALVLRSITTAAALAAAPLALLALANALRMRRAAIVTTIVLLPYFCYGVMEVVVNTAGRAAALLFTLLTVAAYFAAIDSPRQQNGRSVG
ncbi:MAG: hypothetical protein FJ197_09005 [Gammaproteobacteria bacterium]|nr:hypothetical protein [Gammaproteobacteria bacterium]